MLNDKFIKVIGWSKKEKLYPELRIMLQLLYKASDESKDGRIPLPPRFEAFMRAIRDDNPSLLSAVIKDTKRVIMKQYGKAIINGSFTKNFMYQRHKHK